jgi:hypothetical protein
MSPQKFTFWGCELFIMQNYFKQQVSLSFKTFLLLKLSL